MNRNSNKLIWAQSTFYSNHMVGKRLCILFTLFLIGCIVPEEPKYEFKEGLIYIDAFAFTTPGISYVAISESIRRLGALTNIFIRGADVSFRNITTGLVVRLIEENGIYVPLADFVVSIGESWELSIDLPNGKQYRALSEEVLKPVGLSNIRATYNPELSFITDLKRFVPGHLVSIDIEDPIDEKNYYFWKFRSFERLLICETCDNQIFRNGRCIDVEGNPNGESNLGDADYFCDGDCWRIRYNENIELFSDEFATGGMINNLPVGEVLLYTRKNILIEVQQISLTEKEYDYYKVLNDLVDNNSGLNAPPPAALIGNVFNPNDSEEFVLGRFTTASSVTQTIFINRESISESVVEPSKSFKSECEIFCGIEVCNSPEGCAFESIVSCSESRFRTSIKPEGWIE